MGIGDCRTSVVTCYSEQSELTVAKDVVILCIKVEMALLIHAKVEGMGRARTDENRVET